MDFSHNLAARFQMFLDGLCFSDKFRPAKYLFAKEKIPVAAQRPFCLNGPLRFPLYGIEFATSNVAQRSPAIVR